MMAVQYISTASMQRLTSICTPAMDSSGSALPVEACLSKQDVSGHLLQIPPCWKLGYSLQCSIRALPETRCISSDQPD